MPSTQIQWFPGHMAKTRRIMKESLPQVDILINVSDARIPYSSENPEIEKIADGKPMLTLLSKTSLADPTVTDLWKKYYEQKGRNCLFTDSITGYGIKDITPKIKEILSSKVEKYEEKGMSGRTLKAMIVGIPNVGKSSLINKLVGSKKVKVENRPGVTLTKQWVSTSIGLELMDMPGVLWPKFENRTVGENLVITGAVKDDIMDTEAVAVALVGRLRNLYPKLLCERYKLTERDVCSDYENWEIFELIGKKRGFLISGGEVNYERTASALLEEFRSAKIGRITLERPGKQQC